MIYRIDWNYEAEKVSNVLVIWHLRIRFNMIFFNLFVSEYAVDFEGLSRELCCYESGWYKIICSENWDGLKTYGRNICFCNIL